MAALINCVVHGITYERECPECKKYPYDAAFAGPAYRPMDERSLRPPLVQFASAMEAKLRKNDHKGGWRNDPIEALRRLMMIEIEEYNVAREFYGSEAARSELVDIANFAMMLWDRYSREQ